MMLKGTKLYSILKMKCPQCQEGNFFEGHPYNISKLGKVKKRCPNCDLKFELETGFYQGSYYVSYGLGVALFIAVFVLNFLFREQITPTFLMVSFLISLLIFFPLLYALSKIIWATLFIKYEKQQSKSIRVNKNDSRT